MKTSEDESCPGLNERLRPRKSSCAASPQNKSKSKTDGKVQDHSKKTSKLTKLSPSKQNDLTTKSDFSPTLQFLCPYCDRKFSSRRTISKHVRCTHLQMSKPKASLRCLFCSHFDTHAGIMRHMIDSHRNQYFACLDCQIRFYTTLELAEHKLSVCEKQKPYRNKLHQKVRGKKPKKSVTVSRKCDVKEFKDGHSFNSIVISCELKPMQDQDPADIEDEITTNLILPASRSLESNSVVEKNAIIVLDDIQWNKSIPPKFTFHSADPDQILSRLGVVHRSPRTAESTKKDWFKLMDESAQKFDKCFDTKFYSKVASNVQENMSKFLDGSCNFNPVTENTIRTRKTKNNVVINTADGFPILLASEQYSRSALDGYQPRPIAPKHKWKWEYLESDRSVFDPSHMKRDTHTNNCIITLVSRLDIWTQLSMRRKFEEIFSLNRPVEKKTEKQNIISKQLKEILESREIPTTSHIVRYTRATTATSSSSTAGLPMALGLMPTPPAAISRPTVLSGEWVRPRCYMCCVCGEQCSCPKGLSTHISINHPNAHVQYYDIVGEKLLDSDILKYLYVPPSQVSNRTRLPRGFKECTKCNNSVMLEELHQHMLECAGDTPTVRRRHCRHRPFGVRRRRTRIPENLIQKKIRRDIRMQPKQKNGIRSRPRMRTEVGDAETIRKMLAGLPAKRHRVLVNPVSMIPKSRRKLDRSRNKLIMKRSSLEDKPDSSCKFPNKPTSCDVKMQFKDIDNRSVRSPNDKPLNSKADNNTLQHYYENRPLRNRQNTIIEKKKDHYESLRQQKIVTVAKRKSTRVRKIIPTRNYETVDKITDASTSRIIEDSISKPPLRFDVKKANCDASDNRNSQSSGSSDVSGGRHQPYAPVQNVPLKHSIARLTANSETHDKSVQFHHLFLVQQECNNADQHTSSGSTHLFKNETVVTRLHKPPLNNKLNKPKKGLNDCIAMLKNKLSEPKHCQTTGYISAHCESDEPIGIEPSTIKAESINNPAQVLILSECPSDGVFQDSTSKENKEFATPEKQSDIFFTASPVLHETEISSRTTKNTDGQVKSGFVNIFSKPKETVLYTVVTYPSNSIQTSLNDEQVAVKQIEANVQTKMPPQFGIKAPENTHENKKDLESMPPKPTPTFIAPKTIENQHLLNKTNSKSESFSNSPIELKEVNALYLKPAETHLNVGAATVSRKSVESNFSFGVADLGIPTAFPHLLETSLNIEGVDPPEVIGLQCYTSRRTKLNLNENMSPCARPIMEVNPNNYDSTIDNYKPQLNERINAEISTSRGSKISRLFLSNQPKTAKHINLNTEKQKSVDAFTERRIRNIPPAHASIKGDLLKVAPLDLSSKVIAHESHSNLGFGYNVYRKNFETLDLCKKKSDSRTLDIWTTKDEVVDLRLKPTEDETSDLCYENTSDNDYANMSHKFLRDFNCPTDLSLKGKYTSVLHFPSSCANDIIKDFSKSKPMSVETGRLISSACSREMSEKIVKARSRGSLSTSVTDLSDLVLSPVKGTVDEITSKFTSKKTCQVSELSHYADKESRVEQLRGLEKRGLKPSENRYSSLILKPVYYPTLKIPHYKIRNKASNTEISLTADLAEATTTSSTSITAEIFSKTPSGLCNAPQVFRSASRGALSGGIVLQSMPYLSKASNSVTESAVPVYTLANACIPATNIETTNFVMLTNTLLSIPGSTVTKTAPVYTLTDTIIGSSSQYDGTNNDFFNGSASVQNLNSTTILRSDPTSQPISQTPTISKQYTSNKIDTNETDQDPDTTRQIAMLPKELVDIIGNLPVDQRKQLLNILPQYVSTSNQVTTVGNASVLGNAVVNMEKQQRELINNSSLIEKKKKLPYDVYSGIEEIQEPKQALNATQAKILSSKDITIGIRTLGISSLHPSLNLISPPLFSNCIRIQKNVFEDDIAPPVTKALGSSCSIPMSTSGMSDPELTTINASLQMSDSEKTASLRAVRIKAPSEREKGNKLSRKEAKEHFKIQKISEPARSIALESIELINASAIQQAEISSTQQSKLSNIELKPKSVIPVKRTELNKLNLDAMSTTNHVYLETEKDKSPNHLKSRPFIESIKIITGPVEDKSDTNFSNDQSHVGMVAHALTTEDGKEILKLLSTETDRNEVVANIFEKDHRDEYKNAQWVKSNVTVDYDSEDDLILSTIQKINLNERTVDKARKHSMLTTNKRNTKGKMVKKSKQDKGIMVVDQYRKPVVGVDHAAIKQDGSDRSKLRHRGINTEYDVHQIDKKPSSRVEINKVIDICLNNKNPKQEVTNYCDEGNDCKGVSSKDAGQTLQVCEVAVTEKQEVENFLRVQNMTKTQHPKQHKSAAGKEISKNRKRKTKAKMNSSVYTTLRETPLQPIERQSDLSGIAIQNSYNKARSTGSKIIIDLKHDSKVIEETKDREVMHRSSKQKKSYGLKKKTPGIGNNELVPELQPASNYNVMTPLRRSLRGKSLYVESNSTIFERDNLNTDMIPEHKAPLPKKQRTFYKLLHDEQIHHKSLNLRPEKELNKDDTLNVSYKVQPLGSTAITINTLENTYGKFDKRKQSINFKRKCKKKKPVSYRNIPEVSTKTDNLKLVDQSLDYINCTNVQSKKMRTQKIVTSTHEESTKISGTNHMSAGVSENNEETSNQTSLPAEKRKICKASSITGMETDLVPVSKKAKLSMNSGSKIPEMCQHTTEIHCRSVMRKKSVLKSKTAKNCIDKVSKMPEISQHSTDTKGISNPKAASTMNIKTVLVSMPKKGELSKIRESASTQVSQCTTETENISVKIDNNVNDSRYTSENKAVITCYDVPVAPRRARSESLITTSPAGIYDPYDIDLDDMIQIEPLRKLPMKRAKIKGKLKVNQNHSDAKVIGTEGDFRLKLKFKRNKQEKLLFKSKNGHSSTKLKDSNCKKSNDAKYKTVKLTSKYKTGLQTQKAEEGSDSVDSSKSDDVTLKKYVEDMKSIATLKTNICVETTDKEKVAKTSKRRYKKSRHSSVTYGITEIVTLESEENFCSEQFMESFGFFSERKPRKSNLLAAKKISESFHVTSNESDDSYLDLTDPVSKRTSQSESNKKSSDIRSLQKLCNKKKPAVFVMRHCHVCKRVFRRPDNYVRHLLSSVHLMKLAKIEINVIVLIAPQRPNCLVFFRDSLKRSSFLHHKLETLQSDIERTQTVLPTFSQMIIEVFKKAKILHFSRHCGLNRDEALFLDCCEMLKESHRSNRATHEVRLMSSHNTNCQLAVPLGEEDVEKDAEANKKYLQFLEREIEKSNSGFVDTTAVGVVMESEEVRHLEKDLIGGLKDAAGTNADSHLAAALTHTEILSLVNNVNYSHMDTNVKITLNNAPKSQGKNKYQKCMNVKNPLQPDYQDPYRTKKYPQFKEKMYPDIEEIDMYEDKFDKIKRKCRSQAAAAKQNMQVVRKSITEGTRKRKGITFHRHKGRKKLQTKKAKKKAERTYRNSVLTKGALKGFDVIKVSIPTAAINLSAIVPPKEITYKKKNEVSSKKKKIKKAFKSGGKHVIDRQCNDSSLLQKKVDVYEFMDNEDSELFEFRSSKPKERFKKVINEEKPNMSKRDMPMYQVDNPSISGSDGDDFVYMSDDYMCSSDDTDNSLLSCELSSRTKKLSLLKRKDFVEKNALMGKIFKNAVKSEKRPFRSKEVVTTIANLDQLFDSLLEEEPSASISRADNDNGNPSATMVTSPKYKILKAYDRLPLPRSSTTSLAVSSEKLSKGRLLSDRSNTKKVSDTKNVECNPLPSKFEIPRWYVFGPLTSKYVDEYTPHEANNMISSRAPKTYKTLTTADDLSESLLNKFSISEFSAELDDNAGVARKRARRKCTVGKQNVLAETWSSESELDGVPARLYSQSSGTVVAGAGRRKKGRKKYNQHSAGRRYKVTHNKKQDTERVNSNRKAVSGSNKTGGFGRCDRVSPADSPPSPVAGPSGLCSSSGWKPRSRISDYNWCAEEDESQEHQPQHGWIVGDSHKKLVTMLAHAKGRKRFNDDKRNPVE